MKTKIVWGSVILVLFAALGYWWWAPQTITMADGTKLTLVGITYGKRHVYPGKADKRRGTASFNTTNETLCLWVRQKHKSNNYPNYQLLAMDGDKTGCVGGSTRTFVGDSRQGNEIAGIMFDAFPRHGWKIYFYAQARNMRNGQPESTAGHFSINNPAHGKHFDTWTPDAIPNTQQADDVSVTLTRLVYGAVGFNFYGQTQKPNDPTSQAVEATFHVEQNGNVVTNWQPVRIETMDGTGNHASGYTWSQQSEGDNQTMKYQWGLWPQEPAWKLRVEFSRNSGFNNDETWTVSDIPMVVGDINDTYRRDKKRIPFTDTTLGETHLQMYPVTQLKSAQAQQYGDISGVLQIHADPAPEGSRMTLLKVTDDQNQPVEFYNWGDGGGDYRFALRKLGDAKYVRITLALHRSRYVEFTVKPTKE